METCGRFRRTVDNVLTAAVSLGFAAALVYDPQFVVGYTPPEPFGHLWMGDPMGKVLHLTVEHWRNEMPLRSMAREIAQAGKATAG